MFDLSPEKLLLIGVIALLVLGPNRLPAAARTLGRTLHQVRSMSGSLQTEMRDALAEPRQALNDAVGDMGLPSSIPKIPSVRDVVNQAFMPVDTSATETTAEAAPVQNVTRNPFDPDDVEPAPQPAQIGTGSSVPDDPTLN